MTTIEILNKAIEWQEEIEKREVYLDGFRTNVPSYYHLFDKMPKYYIDLKAEERHLQRLKKVFNKIINQIKTY